MLEINWYNTCQHRSVRACLTFYRTLALPLIGISLICAYQVWQAHSPYFIVRVLWAKVLTSIVIGTYIFLFRSRQFVFYNNLGYTVSRLFIVSFVLDFLIWVSIVVTVTLLW